MKKLFSLLIFFIAFSINAQIVTNVDKLRINEITEMQEAGKVLVIDSNNLVQWVSEDKITPDLSDYYTKIDVDAILEDYYDKGEVDALLSDIDLSNYYTKNEADGRFALRSRSITGTGGLTGGGDLTANRTLDLSSSTKSDIAKGVIANGWGDHEGLYLPVSPSSTYKKTETTDLNNLFSSFLYAGVNSDNKPSGSPGMVLTGISASENGGQIFVSRGSENDLYFREHSVGSNFPWKKVWDSSNLTKLSDLNNDLSLQDVMDNNNSANNMKITDLDDGVDAGDAVNKSQLDALESPFEVVDVTQQAYSDIAIVVKDFDNIANGMTYQEGAIDFGVSRDSIHEMGVYGFKVGLETTASGVASSAFGNNTTASGNGSSAFGNDTTASGYFSSAFGNNTTASGTYSSAFGDNATASGVVSSAFGNNTTANEYASLAIGQYSTDGPVETTWAEGSPIFKVGNGTGAYISKRKNAYTLYNDGRSEQEKDMEVTTIGQGFVLKSPDGTRWRITVDNNGALSAEQL